MAGDALRAIKGSSSAEMRDSVARRQRGREERQRGKETARHTERHRGIQRAMSQTVRLRERGGEMINRTRER